jgi:hypothetical protein
MGFLAGILPPVAIALFVYTYAGGIQMTKISDLFWLLLRIYPKCLKFRCEMSEARQVTDLPLLYRFKQFYRDICQTPLDSILEVYDNEVVFKDPIHEINGIAELRTYLQKMNSGVSEGRFEYLDQLVGIGSAYIKWDMHFRHPKLGDKQISVRGMTHIQFSDRIYFHEDTYDMGAMIYEHLPLAGSVVRLIKHRLAQQ